MATASVTRETVGRALKELRRQCQYNPRELNALNRAALELEASDWLYDAASKTLVMQSATDLRKRYTITADGCTCKAGQAGVPCKHRAGWELLQRAEALAQQPRQRTYSDAEYARIQAEAAELFA